VRITLGYFKPLPWYKNGCLGTSTSEILAVSTEALNAESGFSRERIPSMTTVTAA
jgi:hypothetical protein